jgi:type IV pilus assembly protein PilM
MAQRKAAWGIDIGQSSLKAIKLEHSEATDQVVAVAFDYVAYPKILSQPDAIPEEIVAEAMKTFLSRNSIENDLIAISVPGHSSLARFIQLPPVESSKLAEIVKYEARQQIPFALEEVIWDFQPLGAGVEESGYLLDAEVGLFAMKRDQVMTAMRPFTSNKVEVELVQTAPLALYNVLSYDELGIHRGQPVAAQDEYTIVLDMGCDNTTLMISNGAKIWIRNVPIGGNHFTRALTKEMKLSFAKAEHLKCNATKSPDPRAVFQALRPVFNDYVSEIQRSIGYFSSVNRQAKVAKVLGLGNGFKLAGLQKFLQQNLQYEVEKPDSFKSLAGDSVINAPLFADNILSFAVPYGLALQTLDVTRIHTTLLPPEIASARLIRRKKPWAVLAAAVLLLGAVVGMIANSRSYAAVFSAPFDNAIAKATEFGTEVSGKQAAYDAEVAKRSSAQKGLEDLVVGRRSMDWMDLFNAINDALPRDENETAEELPIGLRNQVSVTTISAVRGGVSEWYEALPQEAKDWMTPKDQEAAPEGAEYLVTIIGKHWHHVDGVPEQNDILYLKNGFLKNLQMDTIQRPGSPPRDIRRMGITHPTVFITEPHPVYLPKEGEKEYASRVNLAQQGAVGTTNPGGPGFLNGSSGYGSGQEYEGSSYSGGSYPGGSYPGMGMMGMGGGMANGVGALPPNANPDDYDKLVETDFKIEFAYKPIPVKERESLTNAAEGGEGEAAGDAAASEETPPAS